VTDLPSRGRILIVEDNERNLKLVRDLLEIEGYEIIEARNAETGVALATEQQPNLILMDVGLPDIDGVTALGRLRSDGRTASIVVVAVTAYAMAHDRRRLLDAGFDGYIEKPIDVQAFREQVGAMLRSARPEATA
jgi:two-component system cell cycle response regulator DivK